MEDIRIFALGGLDEDGKNMYCVEINDDIFHIALSFFFYIPYSNTKQNSTFCIF